MYAMECQNAEPTSCATCSQAEMEQCVGMCVGGMCARTCVCVVCAHARVGAQGLCPCFCMRAQVCTATAILRASVRGVCERACVYVCVCTLCVCARVLACVCVLSPCGSSSGRWAPRCCPRRRPPRPAAGGSGWPRGAAG